MRQVETLAGARQAHVGEAALLLHLARVVERTGVREDALLQAADEDDLELEALGGVERDERDLVGVAGVGVLVGHQGRLLQEPVEGIGGLQVAVAIDDLAQLEQVGPAVLAVLGAVHEHGPVARILERQVEQLRQRDQADAAPQALHERTEAAEGLAGPGRQLAGALGCRPEGRPDIAAARRPPARGAPRASARRGRASGTLTTRSKAATSWSLRSRRR